MFTTFLFEKLSHLRQFYGTEQEFITHLLSGEVTVPVPDLLKYVEEYNAQTIPSQWKHGDKVLLCLMPEGGLYQSYPGLTAEVLAVHFYSGKVKYDLEIKFAGEMSTRIYNIDSVFVLPRPEKDATTL